MATDSKKILISIDVKQTGAEGVSNSTKKATQDLSKLTEAEIKQRIEAEKLKITNAGVSASFREQAAAQLMAANSGKPLRAQSGLNNAILLETSRLASDASYGFQGMANNLGQIVSLFFSFSKTAGGTLNSLKQLGRSLLGSGGLLIGIQLLIAFGDDIYNFFFGASKAAEEFKKKIDELTKSISNQIVLFDRLATGLVKFSTSGNALKDTVSLLSNRFSKFENGMKRLKEQGLDQNDDAVKNLVNSFGRLLNVEKELIIADEKYKKSLTEQGKETKESIKQRGIFNQLLRELIELEKLFELETKKGTKATQRRNKAFREGDLDFEQERQKSRERILKDLTKSEEAQTIVQFQGIRDRARIKTQEFKDDQKRRLDAFLKTIENDKNYEEQKNKATESFNKSIREAEEELLSYILQINKEQAVALQNLTIEQSRQLLDFYRKRDQDLAVLSQKRDDQEILNEGIKAGNLLELRQNQLESDRLFIQQRLDSENLSFKERVRLQQDLSKVEDEQATIRINIAEAEAQGKRELLNQVGNALSAFSDLAGKETKAGKALAITSTLISTYSSAQKAFESQFLPIPTSTSPLRGALAAAAAVASGLSNVKAIMSEGKSKPSAAKSQVNVEAPDFNVVGASPESQLAQSVAEQQVKPVKAFVVGKDITNQQELDRNIVTTAGLSS